VPVDRFAHLRENLETFRTHTAYARVIPWCASCEVHQAAVPGGLCPVCESDLAA
jgi:hypothetical protein